MQLSFIWDHLTYSYFFSDVGRPSSGQKWHYPDTWNGKKILNLMSNTVFLFPIRVSAIKMITEKSFMFKDAEFIFCGSFSISGKIWALIDEDNSIGGHMFFLLFYFIRNFAPLKPIELSGSNFRMKNWSLYANLRFSPLNGGGFSKFAPSVFFEYGVRLRSR